MFRIHKIKSSARAKEYYRHSDYYLEAAGEWLGKGADRLGLKGPAEQADFEALCDNIDPRTGERLTQRTAKNRRVGWDFNFNASKSVSIAREMIGFYDPAEGQRIEDAHREAVAYTVAMMEKDIACRVRAGRKNENEITGNGIFMRVTHRTTRPNEDDLTPDPDLHDHVVCANATFAGDGKAKAVQEELLYKSAPYFEAVYHNRLAANLKELGYGVRRRGKGFEIDGISEELIDRFSRRRKTIKAKAKELGITSAEGFDALGATTRLGKAEGVATNLPAYWDGKLTDAERNAIRDLKRHNSRTYESTAEKSVTYAIAHEFYRNSVVDARRLYETAIRHGIGSVTPEDIEAEARRQGVLFHGDQVTTRAVLGQEQRIIGFAREGKGACRPIAPERRDRLEGLSDEQAAAVRHVWRSRDRLMLIRGAPGAGKTTMMKPALDRLGVNAVLLAPSSDASRGKLREDGQADDAPAAFREANTVATFLGDSAESRRMRDKAKNGIVWIDEASLLGIDDLEKICGLARSLDARIVLQGDPRQHKAVQRHGNMLETLADFAGLKVAEINKIQRQKGEYAEAVEAIRNGQYEKGVDILYRIGSIVEGDGHDQLVERYAREVEQRGAKNIIIVNPTHADGGALTEKLREVRKAAGLVAGEERAFAQWTDLKWTPAERGDAARYDGDEVVQFYHNTGRFKAGQRITAAELLPHLAEVNPEHFGVFRAGEIGLAKGDVIRITNNGRDTSGEHRVDNGRIDTIAGFTKGGDIRLSNGWVIGKDFAHLRHGLVSTSPAAQSKDDLDAWQQLNRASLGAAGAEQFLVSLSRGKRQALVFTDLSREELIDAVSRADNRKSATEVFMPMPKRSAATQAAAVAEKAHLWMHEFIDKACDAWHDTRRRIAQAMVPPAPERGPDMGYAR